MTTLTTQNGSVNNLFYTPNLYKLSESKVRDQSLLNIITPYGKITEKESKLLAQLRNLWIIKGAHEFDCTREFLANYIECHPQYITDILKKYAPLFYRRYTYTGRGENRRVHLHININIMEWCRVFGTSIYGTLKGSLLAFLKEKVAPIFEVLRQVFPLHKKPLEEEKEEEKTITRFACAHLVISKNNFFDNTNAQQETISSQNSVTEAFRSFLPNPGEEPEHPKKEAVDPITPQTSPMLTKRPDGDYISFDRTVTECPSSWIEIALERGMHEHWIANEFQTMRDYYIKLGKRLKGKHCNWNRVWSNWIDNALNYNYSKKKPIPGVPLTHTSFNAKAEEFFREISPVDPKLKEVTQRLKKGMGDDYFKSWIVDANVVFKPNNDIYKDDVDYIAEYPKDKVYAYNKMNRDPDYQDLFKRLRLVPYLCR